MLAAGIGLRLGHRFGGEAGESGSGSPYVEVGTLGKTATNGTSAANSAADTKYACPSIVVPAGGVWFKTFMLGFRTAAVGNKFKPILYAGTGLDTDTLVIEGPEYVFGSAFTNTHTIIAAPAKADGSAVFLPEGAYSIGELTASTGMAIEAAAGGSFSRTADAYMDGASPTFGAVSSFGVSLLAYINYSLGGP